jgi:ankyrin repeat protein
MNIRSVIVSALAMVCMLGGCASEGPGRLSIHFAAAHNDVSSVRTWLRSGISVDSEYSESHLTIHGCGGRISGKTPLMFAAESRSFEVVKLLVESGADLYRESTGCYGARQSVFDYAIEGGDARIARLLWVASDKKTMLKNLPLDFLRAFDTSCSSFSNLNRGLSARSELLEFLLMTFDHQYASEALWRISDRQCFDTIRFILDRGIRPSQGALVTAASLGITEIVNLYLEKGTNVNGRGHSAYTYLREDVTPLIAASGRMQIDTMRLLLSKGADPNLQDSMGRTALIAAISEIWCPKVTPACDKHIDAIEDLLHCGARVDIADKNGKTAVDYLTLYPEDPYKAIKRELLSSRGQMGPCAKPRSKGEIEGRDGARPVPQAREATPPKPSPPPCPRDASTPSYSNCRP